MERGEKNKKGPTPSPPLCVVKPINYPKGAIFRILEEAFWSREVGD